MSPDARLTQSQAIEAEQKRQFQVISLAQHYALRRGNADGLSYNAPKRDEYAIEETERYEAFDEDALEKATATLTAWQEGDKWTDDAYVRDNLIYSVAGNAIDKQRREEHADDETYWMPTSKEWTPIYTAAAEKVDAIGEPH